MEKRGDLSLSWGHPQRDEANSLLCFLSGSWGSGPTGAMEEARVPAHSCEKELPESDVARVPMEINGPTLRLHFSTLTSFSASKAEKQDGAGSYLHCVVKVSS